MTVEEIFNSPIIRRIEVEILDAYYHGDHHPEDYESSKMLIRRLLEKRKELLDEEFVMDENYKILLAEFNEAMRNQLLIMRKEAMKAYHGVCSAACIGEIEVTGKCFLGYRYAPLHPIQTIRAKKIWYILCGSLDDFHGLYESDGVMYFGLRNEMEISENKMLYLGEEPDNWNEHLDHEMTKDMNLVYAFHNLFDHTLFSIFDLLWVRDFTLEITVEMESCNYEETPDDTDDDDIDFDKHDYDN